MKVDGRRRSGAIASLAVRQPPVRQVMVIVGLLALAVMVLMPEALELLELGQLVADLHAAWKKP
ncbi:MAG: hypothetical protein GQE15_12895 [Archangiaceae bacterium]|nr:hypothetical protein [Archangiaceae bacterium]